MWKIFSSGDGGEVMLVLRTVLVATVGAICLSAMAQSERPAHAEESWQPSARENYLRHCAACHGADGTGATVASDFSTPEATVRLTQEGMRAVALHGHDAAISAGWTSELDARELDDVVDYIREALMLPTSDSDASTGRHIYARTCSVCHGEKGDGASLARNSLNPPPLDFTKLSPDDLSRARMVLSVSRGVEGTAMMPFASQLSPSEIMSVVDYVRVAFMRHEDPTQTADDAGQAGGHGGHAHHDHGAGDDFELEAPFQLGLIGDFARGQAFYDRNCAECHGITGDGEGRRAYFMTRKPRDFTSPPARAELNRPHLFEAIADGIPRTEMSAWSKVIPAQTIADVAEYVFQAFIVEAAASEPGNGAQSIEWTRQTPHDQKKKQSR